jgi:invasion protein IalB
VVRGEKYCEAEGRRQSRADLLVRLARVLMPLAVAATWSATASTATAQQRRPPAPAPAETSQQAQEAQAASAQGRTEILTYDNWTVTCRDGRDPKEKRVCSAELSIFQEAQGQRRAVFAWIMGLNKDGALTSAFRFLPGISIVPGMELKFADKPARKVPITSCEPSVCEATTPMDDGFIKEASQLVQAEAIVTASDGRQVTFTINMKGFAPALAAIRR